MNKMSKLKHSKHLKIPLEEIKRATNSFEVSIGKGGYGKVYKGKLTISGKPTTVAVKRLNEKFGQGLKEFLTEIQLLSGQKHPNLISLLGYCDDGMEKLIIYEYAQHGSLDKYLTHRRSNTTTLTWLKKVKICIDVARGLDYLHNHVGKHQTIIHRDIKSANILIDENWVAKISDLGLSKLSLSGLNRSDVVSRVCGTIGYCEPEYFRTNIVRKESDVYSFGIVLFEVFCGRLCTIEDNDGVLLSGSLAKDYYDKKKLDEIVDPFLKEEMNLDSMNKFAATAYGCLHDDREQRPTMGLVVKELEESLRFQIEHDLLKQSFSINDDGKDSEWISSEKLQNSSSKSHSRRESQSSSSNYSRRESQSSNSKSFLKMEMRLEKVREIFQQFDLNKDGGLNRKELEALLLATNSDLKSYTQKKISTELDEVFRLYDEFIDGEKGLTCYGLLRIYEDGDADLEFDLKALGRFESKSYDHIEPNFINTWQRPLKVRRIFQLFDFNQDGCLNREELAAYIIATNPNIRYSEEDISNCLDHFFGLYEKYINGEKDITFGGLLLSYDKGDRDLDLDFYALRLQLNPYIDDELALYFIPRKSFLVAAKYWVLTLILVLMAAWTYSYLL